MLSYYSSQTAGVKANLYRLLMHGKLKGTGKLLLLAVDQGFEHGADQSFSSNPEAYDPLYFFDLAITCGFSGYTAPLGSLEMGADQYAGQIPLILKLNSSYRFSPQPPRQYITASVDDALRLGCVGIGFTLYMGSSLNQIEEFQEIAREAKSKGLFVMVWSYPRGEAIEKNHEMDLDIIAYGAHMACLLGAHIVKVKMPSHNAHVSEPMDKRVLHIVKNCFDGKRMVIFSGGNKKSNEELLTDVQAIQNGCGFGSVLGRNIFQRTKEQAINIIDKIITIYRLQG